MTWMINPALADPPDWARVIAIAKWLGVAPWELAKQPTIWQTWVSEYINAQASAKQGAQ